MSIPPSQRRTKDSLLRLCKWMGLFRLARLITRRGIRILCYHGFAQLDEIAFRPSLFISLGAFDRRLQALADGGYSVLPLSRALEHLERGDVPPDTVVITVDDVFHNFQTDVMPLIERHAFPATAYVTTYYSVKNAPVFRLVVRYMFWRTTRPFLDLSGLEAGLEGRADLGTAATRRQAEETLISIGESLPTEAGREDLIRRLSTGLAVDLTQVNALRVFHIVTPAQINDLASRGVDIQLHTHRHKLPEDSTAAAREIADNRAVLAPLVKAPLVHLCYPSGIWSRGVWPALEAAGIRSATTCDPGLNFRGIHRYGLRRILDAEDVTQIRFEAELSGLAHLVRAALGRKASAGSDLP
jgi:peptidoglycan/xylan/chitin deacetylase (PgdA/CDA1 family)